MKKEINVRSNEFYVKVVDFLQQNWALIENENQIIIWFIDDNSGVFDRIIFDNLDEAEKSLLRNGFKKYLDPDEMFTEFLRPPQRPFFDSPRKIYSTGKYWH